jgi:hypothetical protein
MRAFRTVTSIAAMPNKLRPTLLALILAAAAGGVLGCGDSGPDPSLSAEEAAVLTSKIDEIQRNVDVGSCLVAADKTDELLADVSVLPDSVDQQVKNALTRGATNLKDQLEDPSQCEGNTETTTSTPSTIESTTESTTTETNNRPETTTTPTQTQQTTTTQTQTTTPTPTTGGSGGIGPGGL